jgi:phenylalanyl-tRNA synthetase alpha chain
MKEHIYKHFKNITTFDNLDPIVSLSDNFDKLLIPQDHPARSKSDTYYVNENLVLRTHTSAHQCQLLEQGHTNFLVTGHVFRKDEIDRFHYPVFHQMEGVMKVDNVASLFDCLDHLVRYLFPNAEYKISKDYFPFTDPSYEVEVLHNGKWVEILGAGMVHENILKTNSLKGNYMAFGLGLERLCMIFFDIPDIRLFWSNDAKFTEQFTAGTITKFKPYSLLPSQSDDISFWINPSQLILENNNPKWLQENDFNDFVRNQYPSWIESVTLIDSFTHPKTHRSSRTYKISFSPDNSNITNLATFTEMRIEMFNSLKNKIRETTLLIELR